MVPFLRAVRAERGVAKRPLPIPGGGAAPSPGGVAPLYGSRSDPHFARGLASVRQFSLKGSAFASLTSVENSDICQKLFFYFDKFLSNVWKLVRSHHRQRNDIHYDALQFPEITNLTSVQLILTNVRMKYLSRHIFSLKQQLVRQNRLRRFDSDKCHWGRCMALLEEPNLSPNFCLTQINFST